MQRSGWNFATGNILIVSHMGVVFPFMRSLSLDRCNFYFKPIFMTTLTFGLK